MMASSIFSHTCSILLVLVFLSSWAESDTNMPLALPPFSDDNLCDVVNCGRGNCSVDVTKPYSFVCECEPGWRRTRSDNEDKLQFLPCVIPDCTLDYSCMPAPPPSPPIPPIPDNISLFDPCYWTYCGEGTCTKNLTYTHTCQCNPGYTNLMNISHFPCFSSCAIGMDCRRLGISMQDTTSPPNDSNSQDDHLCNAVNCGKGNCSVDVTKPFSFVCECEPGWRRTRFDDEDELQFLPCVIPNCTLDYSCMPASPPSPPIPDNISLFDPCYWTYCGEGTCTKNLTYTHTCECNPGYTNLMNISHFPCFSICAIGMDCRRLGISMQDTTSPPSDSNSQGSPPNDSNSQGTKFLHGGFHWIGFTIISVVMALME